MTVGDLYRMPDDGRLYELEAGRLVSEPVPGARHGRVAAVLVELLGSFARGRELGVVLSNDAGYVLAREPDTVRGPDVSFISRKRYAEFGDLPAAFPGPPDLAVEVLSPGNTPPEIHAKVADYLAAGTRLVWVVDPETERAAVYRSLLSPRTLGPDDELDGEDVLPGFRVRVGEICRI
jgi:Uma2 family endonuclease